ncbi:MAG: DUF2807 domain-containing protein [Lewinellaceae bacterium]|nr:DUF2807 domain-containing protein [Phaeodactylibacter sp.]MCB0612856.1 DUF2807 domain-containing protein [Phaeodactylibacter sp.]MCB9351460.1 DUF2807 domain-containing protein [Lewinellaceae bacterium]
MKNRIIIFSTLLAFFLTSCITDYDGGFFGQGIKGEGPMVSKTLNLEGFSEIDIATSGELYLSQGDTYAVKVEAQQNIIDNLDAKVSGAKLTLGFDKSVSSFEALKFYVTMPTLKGVSIAGSADVAGATPFTGLDGVDLNIAGAGNIQLSLEAQTIDMNIAGSGDMELEGKAGRADASIMGSGSIKAGGLNVQMADISIAGSGDCAIDATDKLDVSIAGSGDVYYFSDPKVEKSIAGSGSVEKK